MTTEPPFFPVVSIDPANIIRDEALGTKDKFWITWDDERWLFKESRVNTGEDWSEKVAAEIAHLLDIPAAVIELAECHGVRGTLSLSFIDRDSGEDLIHGNEILAGQVLDYDPSKLFGQRDHTLENISAAVSGLFSEEASRLHSLRQLASYMVLDGLIGNVDRHHENWGLIGTIRTAGAGATMNLHVAPSYDHASSLGRELLEERVVGMLSEPGSIERYMDKGRGAIYLSSSSAHGENPLRLVEFGSRRFPQYFKDAIARVQMTPLEQIIAVVDRIPEDRISQSAIQFVKRFITCSYHRICKLTT